MCECVCVCVWGGGVDQIFEFLRMDFDYQCKVLVNDSTPPPPLNDDQKVPILKWPAKVKEDIESPDPPLHMPLNRFEVPKFESIILEKIDLFDHLKSF